tara:strand:- start:22 stop:936 length:915 start_codon:yes stop_codon:yes gene_type:complete
MKALVTGSSGFIGKALCQKLLENGHEVLGVDPYVNKLEDENFKFFKGTFSDLIHDNLINFIDNNTSIYHLGATKNKNVEEDGVEKLIESNITDFSNLLDYVGSKNIEKLVFSSSLYVYGTKTNPPYAENSLLAPETYYGISKVIGEKLVEDFFNTTGITSFIFRLFFIYGPGQKTEQSNYFPVIHKTIKNLKEGKNPEIYGDGKQTLDFVFVNDLVDLFSDKSKLKKNNQLNIYNISNNEETSINKVVEIISENMGKEFNPTFLASDWTKGTRRYGDNSKIYKELDWSPKTTLDEGILRCIENH